MAAWHPGAAPAGGASNQSTQQCGGWKSCDILLLWPQGSCRAPGAGAARADGAAVPTLAVLIWARHTHRMGGEAAGGEAVRSRSPRRSMVQVPPLLPEAATRLGTEFYSELPPLTSSPWALSRRQPGTNLRRLLADGVWSHTVKNTLRMPFLNSDPSSWCCRQPRSGTCRWGPLGRPQPGCAGTWQLLSVDWVFLSKNQGFPLLGGC